VAIVVGSRHSKNHTHTATHAAAACTWKEHDRLEECAVAVGCGLGIVARKGKNTTGEARCCR